MAEVHLPDEARLRSAGFASVAHVPALFGRSEGPPARRFYCREYNRYLRERALLEWTPRGRAADELERAGLRLSYPTRKSLRGYAERLANFDDWLVATKRDWRAVRYTEDIVLGYQADMVAGRWAKGGSGLKAATVNVRVQEACLFLRWAAERGLRRPFAMLASPVGTSVRSGTSSRGGRAMVVQARAGAPPREPEMVLTIPTAEKVGTWLRSVQAHRGYTKELMCRFALRGALRLSELAGFRLGDFPDPDATPWHMVGGRMKLMLTHGTKGRRPDPVRAPEIGPPRLIWIPVDLAEELLNYRRLRRLRAANLFRKRVGRLPNRPDDHFFLVPRRPRRHAGHGEHLVPGLEDGTAADGRLAPPLGPRLLGLHDAAGRVGQADASGPKDHRGHARRLDRGSRADHRGHRHSPPARAPEHRNHPAVPQVDRPDRHPRRAVRGLGRLPGGRGWLSRR